MSCNSEDCKYDNLAEYTRRLIDEIPQMVAQGVQRGRKTGAPEGRIVAGVVAHAGALPAIKEILSEKKSCGCGPSYVNESFPDM